MTGYLVLEPWDDNAVVDVWYDISGAPYFYPYPIGYFYVLGAPYLVVWYNDGVHYWWNLAWNLRPPPPFADGPLRTSGGAPIDDNEVVDACAPIRVTQQYVELITSDYTFGALHSTEPDDVAAFSATTLEPIDGDFAAVEPSDVPAFVASIPLTGTLAADEPSDVAAFGGFLPDTFAAIEPPDVAAFVGGTYRRGRRTLTVVIPGEI